MEGKLTIDFDTHGNIACEATGFAGTACETATNQILGDLRAKTTSDTKTDEYYQAPRASAGESSISSRW